MTASSPFPFPWYAGGIGPMSPEYRAALSALPGTTTVLDGNGVWLVGSGASRETMISSAGPHQAAFLGTCRFSDAAAATHLRRADRQGMVGDLGRLPGSFQLVVTSLSGVWLVPDITGLRRFWYGRVQAGTLFATHAVVLASVLGTALDDAWLATRLAAPSLRGAVEERSPFVGVFGVPPGAALRVAPDGRPTRSERWWSPPDPEVALPVAAGRLRAALGDAVVQRVGSVRHASVDLSGGLDSTTLAFLAARSGAAVGTSLTTVTRAPASAANDDPVWAQRALTALGDIEHIDLNAEETLPFGRLAVPPVLDEPDPSAMMAGPMRHQATALAAVGSELHLAGNGGDQLLGAPMAYLGGLVRRHPLLTARHLRGHRALVGLTGRSIAEMLRPGRYADWLALAAAWLEGRPGRVPQTWAALPPLPPGVIAADALAMAGAVLRDVAERAQHVGDIQRYGAVVRLRHTAGVHRLHRDAAASHGLRLELPFFDTDVAEVCLSARLHERVDPYRAKPLLAEAMHGTVPDPLLMRTTMGVYDTELHLGWRRHRNDVRAFLDTTELAERGLVTDTGVARLVEGTLSTQDLFWLNDILATELWLRSLDRLTPLVRSTPATLHANDSGSH